MQSNMFHYLDLLKSYLFLIGLFWGVLKFGHKGVQWISDIKNNHLHHIQESLSNIEKGMVTQNDAIANNTKEVVEQLTSLRQEIRDDLRSMVTALIAKK